MDMDEYGRPVNADGFPMVGGYDSKGRLCYANGMPMQGSAEDDKFFFGFVLPFVLPLVVIFFVLYFFWGFFVGLYGSAIVLFHEPTEQDFKNNYYKMAAYEAAEDFLFQIHKETLEKQGVVVVTSSDRNRLWNQLRSAYLDGKQWSGYENRVVSDYFEYSPSVIYIGFHVDYEGNQTYKVTATTSMRIHGINAEGNAYNTVAQECEEVAIVKCDPKRRFYGRVHMNWELLGTEFKSITIPDEEAISIAKTEKGYYSGKA